MIIPSKKLENIIEFSKREPAGLEIKPHKIFKLDLEEFDYIFIEKDKRGYIKNNKFYHFKEVLKEIKPDKNYWVLDKGYYYVVFPKIRIPKNLVGFAYPRSTLNRLGILKYQTAVFDPGYEGNFNQTFYFPIKAKIHIEEPWIQLVFIKLEDLPDKLYNGYYQKESY